MRKVVEHGGAGYEGFLRKEGDVGIGKLRLAGVYDDRVEGFFMLRTRIPGGHLTVDQARVIGEVTEEFCRRPAGKTEGYGERFIEVTTRQDIQLHWIRVEDLAEIWRRYSQVGLTSSEACGNAARNIVCCPAHGIGEDEVIDAYPLVEEANKYLLEHPEYGAFLPRKFKIAITGAKEDCILARINDLAFTPAASDGETGFNVWGGGGLSDYPRLASPLNLFVSSSEVLETIRACLRVFMDLGDYKHTAINRFRMLVESIGVDRVREEMLKQASFTFRSAGRSLQVNGRPDHVGVYRQRQKGLAYVGLKVPVGRMQGRDLVEIANVAEKYGTENLRTTHRQNILIINVGEEDVARLLEEPIIKTFPPHPTPFKRAVVACTGAPLCKFGNADTKRRGVDLAEYLDERFKGVPDVDDLWLTLHMSGCKASCAQPQIADIGLRATVAKDEEKLEEAFDICLGGSLEEGRLAEWVEYALPAGEVYGGVERLVRHYLDVKKEGESFGAFYRRVGRETVQNILRGHALKIGGGE